jgi:hypothetical protein
MRRFSLALLLAAAALMSVSTVADAAAPTNFVATQSSRVVQASWTLPAGMNTGFLEFSLSNSTDVDGFFTNPATVSIQYNDATASYDSTARFLPGTYYAHVSAYDPLCSSCVDEWSPIVQVVVPTDPAAAPTNFVVRQSGRIVKASWTLPTGMETGFLQFSPTINMFSNGFFVNPATLAYEYLSASTTFDSTPLQFAPGTYYAHVSTYDPTCDPTRAFCANDWSTIFVLHVPPDSPPPTPTPPAAPPDTVTSFSGLSVKSSQKVGKLSIQASMSEAGTITAGGTVSVPKLSKVYKFKTVSATAVAGATVTLKLKLPAKALKAVKKALKKHKKLKAKITITATDSAGNKKTEVRTIKLKL